MTADHVSYWDGPALAVWLDRKAIFAVHPDFAKDGFWSLWVGMWCGFWKHDFVALSGQCPFALRSLLKVPPGTVICLFPEGEIRRGAEPLPWQAGVRYLLEKRPDLTHWHLTACPVGTRQGPSRFRWCRNWEIRSIALHDPARSGPSEPRSR